MKAVIQRVSHAEVAVDGAIVGSCGEGLMILLGVAQGDCEEDAQLLCRKIANLRIFQDDAGKMNRSVKDIDGEALVISQFTLMANYRHGNRPDFMASAKPEEANRLYEYFTELLRLELRRVENGVFGASMQVSLLNNGPVTIVMDSDVLKTKK
ncbi:MAG: D-tyrosyl-tRNA(Tyr) deacylase [Clostridia bacterium]|nr:D-tyrosyl-tRNA(Tyr) deacylase [Clostridia bacterium]MBR2927316.1 D-tyrosyl-tRNA(Tyr) deacylase [Clostridia bacterium]